MHNRKFSNIRLTRAFHMRHMGLWIVVSSLLVALINLLLYLLIMQQWGYTGESAFDSSADPHGNIGPYVAIGLGIENLLFCWALVLLGRTTSHRIAGVFINLQKVCEQIASGERDVRVRFRKYDGLDSLERTMNAMLDNLTGRSGRQ